MKFRRKAADPGDDLLADEADDLETADAAAGSSGSSEGDVDNESGAGPYDAEDLADTDGRVDLGALLLLPVPGTDLQLQVDEPSGQVQSVMFAGPDGALELRVFAAPRHGDLWGEVRPQIAADLAKRGGTADEREGRFGTELVCQMPVTLPDGTAALQPSRVIGINGSRWMLRATVLGKPAVEPEAGGVFEEALATVAVRRGSHAMPVGDALTLTLPPDARRPEG